MPTRSSRTGDLTNRLELPAMHEETVQIESSKGKRGQLILRVIGPLDITTEVKFRELVRAAGVDRVVILDLCAVQRCDSTGLGALITVMKAFDVEGRRLALTGLNARLQLLFEIMQVKAFFTVFESTAEAEETFV